MLYAMNDWLQGIKSMYLQLLYLDLQISTYLLEYNINLFIVGLSNAIYPTLQHFLTQCMCFIQILQDIRIWG